ncbi:DNA-binding ferritin-like protein [Bradyrhizobium sp. JR6.1]
MLAELLDDNKRMATLLREARAVCEEYNDVASTSLIENWIDEAERRTWFLYECTRGKG